MQIILLIMTAKVLGARSRGGLLRFGCLGAFILLWLRPRYLHFVFLTIYHYALTVNVDYKFLDSRILNTNNSTLRRWSFWYTHIKLIGGVSKLLLLVWRSLNNKFYKLIPLNIQTLKT